MRNSLRLTVLFILLSIGSSFAQIDYPWILQAPVPGHIGDVTNFFTDSLGRNSVSYRTTSAPGDSIVIDGITYHGSVSPDVFARYGRDGQLRWVRQFTTKGPFPYSVMEVNVVDNQGNTYISGVFADTLEVGPFTLIGPRPTNPNIPFLLNLAVIKLDSSGNVVWARQSTGSTDTQAGAGEVIGTDREGNVYVATGGEGICFGGYCLPDNGRYVLRYDPLGQMIGALKIPSEATIQTVDKDGNFYMAVPLYGTVTVGGVSYSSSSSNSDIIVAKFSPQMQVLWVNKVGGPAAEERVNNLALDGNGNLYIRCQYNLGDAIIGSDTLAIGNMSSISPNYVQSFMAKFNGGNGQLEWVTDIFSDGDNRSVLTDMAVDEWGNVFLSHYVRSSNIPSTSILYIEGNAYTVNDNASFLIAYSTTGQLRWVEQGKGWAQGGVSNNGSRNHLVPDDAGGVYWNDEFGAINGQVGPYPVSRNNGRNLRYKLRDCEVVQATVVSPITGSYTICNGAPPVEMAAEVTSSGEIQYQWQLNGSDLPGETGRTYSTLQSGDYRIIIGNYNGCIDTSDAVTLTVVNASPPPATVTALTATTVCLGDSVTLSSLTGSGFTYQWKKGNSFIQGATDSVFAAQESGSYSVAITSAVGCAETSQPISITVNEPPVAFISAAGSTAICQNQTVTLVAPPGQGVQYQWMLNGSDISGATSIAYPAGQAGDFSVRMTSADGCSSVSNDIEVTINPAPGIVVNVNGPTTVCQGGAVSLSTPTASGQSYQWQRNGIDIIGETNNTFTATQPGDYRVMVTGNSNLCSNYSQITTVSEDPGPVNIITPAGPTAICPGQDVMLVASPGSGYTYRWFLNGGLVSGANGSLLNASVVGSYRVEITNSRGCFNLSDPQDVTNASSPNATIQTPTANEFCTGDSLLLQAVTGTGFQYQWILNGTPISGATSGDINATTAGVYQLQVTNASGCEEVSSPVTLSETVLTANIAATGDSTICPGGSAGLFSSSTGSYEWLLNGSAISGATGASHNASQAGNFQVVVTNASGCTDTSRVLTVNVATMPSVMATVVGSGMFCTGDSVKLAAPASSGWQYQWQLYGSDISGATDSVMYAATGGNYRVQVTNSSGCSTTSPIVILQESAVPNGTINNASDTVICANGSVSLFTTTSGSYEWLRNGATMPGSSNASITATQAGAYQVVVSNANGCADTSSVINVTVDSIAAANVTASGNTTFCAGDSVLLSAGTGTGLSYEWFRNGATISGATTDSLWATQSGNYSVTVSNAQGCSEQSNTVPVQVNPAPTATITQSGNVLFASAGSSYQWFLNGNPITNATQQVHVADSTGVYTVEVTANGCSATSNPLTVTVTAIGDEDLAATQLNIYPNPASELFYVKLSSSYTGEVQLDLYDMTGRIVRQAVRQKQGEIMETRLQVQDIAEGLYMLRIVQGEQVHVEKVNVVR